MRSPSGFGKSPHGQSDHRVPGEGKEAQRAAPSLLQPLLPGRRSPPRPLTPSCAAAAAGSRRAGRWRRTKTATTATSSAPTSSRSGSSQRSLRPSHAKCCAGLVTAAADVPAAAVAGHSRYSLPACAAHRQRSLPSGRRLRTAGGHGASSHYSTPLSSQTTALRRRHSSSKVGTSARPIALASGNAAASDGATDRLRADTPRPVGRRRAPCRPPCASAAGRRAR